MVIKEQELNRSSKMRVTFSLPASIWADAIYLVGDFNNWSTTATPLRLDEANWSVTLDLDIDRAYQYRYLVNNDEWLSDWNADSHISGHDGLTNSVVITQTSRPAPIPLRQPPYRETVTTGIPIAA